MGRRLRKALSIVLMMALVMTMLPGAITSAATKPALNKTSRNILIGKTFDFNIKNKLADSTYKWTSSDVKVATVNKVGLVKGIKKGSADITCVITASGKKYTLTAKVNVIEPAKGISIKNKISTMNVGDTYDLNRTLTPKTSNDKTTWTSSDESIAKPDSLGKFTAKNAGTVTITATTMSGAKDTVKIKVVAKDLTISAADVKNGKVAISNSVYSNITIDSSVGNAEINLTKVTVSGNLFMETGADYTVKTIESNIANVKVIEPEIKSMAVEDELAPTLIAGRGTIIVNIDADGNITIQQTNMATISNITVTPSKAGELNLVLSGFNGNIVIDSAFKTDINIETIDCDIQNAVIENATEGDSITFVDKFAGTASASTIKSLEVKDDVNVTVDVKTTEIVVAENVKNANFVVSQPVSKLVNNSEGTKVVTIGKGEVAETTGKKANIEKPTPTPTPIPGGGSGGGYVPPVTPSPDPTIPGVDVNNGVYTFDANVVGFTIKVNNTLYPVEKSAVLDIGKAWADNVSSYEVPGTNGLVLERTSTPLLYKVKVPGITADFTMAVSLNNNSVTVNGGTSFTFVDVTRVYSYESNVIGMSIKVGSKNYDLTLDEVVAIREAWPNNESTYVVPGKDLTFERTSTAFLYNVKITNGPQFKLAVDLSALKVTVTGNTDFTVSSLVRK